MNPPKYPIHCPGRFDNHPCPSKRFHGIPEGKNWRWTCCIKKCSETWLVTKPGNSPRRKK